MPGYRTEARDYLGLFDLFVLPSLTEGLPITLLEAMQAGVPIVASRVGGVPQVLEDGRGGVLVEPGNYGALAEAIRRCVDDRPAALRLAAHSKARLATHFSSKTMAAQYLALYRELTVAGGDQ
jgi:glycosyltransferase involved in cell wall biosynthesis